MVPLVLAVKLIQKTDFTDFQDGSYEIPRVPEGRICDRCVNLRNRVSELWPVLGHGARVGSASALSMILELELPDAGDPDHVERIHGFLEPAKRHIEGGGTVILTKRGEQVGVAETIGDLFRLAIG